MFELTKTDNTAGVLKYALDGLSKRQQVISNNIANVDTPGFKGGEVNFESQLQRSMDKSNTHIILATTHPAHLTTDAQSAGTGQNVTTSLNSTLRNDGNNVDIDKEMAQLAETTLTYNVLAQRMAGKFNLLKSIISEGRR